MEAQPAAPAATEKTHTLLSTSITALSSVHSFYLPALTSSASSLCHPPRLFLSHLSKSMWFIPLMGCDWEKHRLPEFLLCCWICAVTSAPSVLRWILSRRLWWRTPLGHPWWRQSGQLSPAMSVRFASTQRYEQEYTDSVFCPSNSASLNVYCQILADAGLS